MGVSLAVPVVVSFSSWLVRHVGHCAEDISHDLPDHTPCVLGHLSLPPGPIHMLLLHPWVLA
jgi:hypothetical protein